MIKHVYTHKQMETLISGVNKLAAKYFNVTTLILTEGEYVQAFIEEDHVPVLMKTQELVGAIGESGAQLSQIKVADTQLNIMIVFHTARSPILVPTYARNGLASSCPASLKERIESWVTERLRVGSLFGDALDALSYLNMNCGNEGAMSVMFPALALCFREFDPSDQSSTAKRAQKILNTKSFGSLPSLTREVKNRLIEVSNLLTACTLLDDNMMPVPAGCCALAFNRFTYNNAPVREHFLHPNARGSFI